LASPTPAAAVGKNVAHKAGAPAIEDKHAGVPVVPD